MKKIIKKIASFMIAIVFVSLSVCNDVYASDIHGYSDASYPEYIISNEFAVEDDENIYNTNGLLDEVSIPQETIALNVEINDVCNNFASIDEETIDLETEMGSDLALDEDTEQSDVVDDLINANVDSNELEKDDNIYLSDQSSTMLETYVDGEVVCQNATDCIGINVEDYMDYSVDNALYPRFYASSMNGNNLTGINKKMYDRTKYIISQIANGKESSTVSSLSFGDLGISTEYMSASELGVNSIIENGVISSEAIDALTAMYGLDDYSIGDIMTAIRNDCPYEAYWMGLSYAGNGYSYRANYDGEWKLAIVGSELSIYITPSADYKGSEDYTVDINKTSAAASTVANVVRLVKDASNFGDMEKLVYYRDSICDLASYNNDAVSGTVVYGDPWQLIYVFDGDDSTEVVCEGYSKAFMYLCEKTTFTDSSINCYTVTGEVDGGAHMWNIVHWKDGINYLADLTFYDGTSFDAYFMNNPSAGNVDEGYTFSTSTYVYDIDTRSVFSDDKLKLNVEDSSSLSDIYINYDPDIKKDENVVFTVVRDGGTTDCKFKIEYIMHSGSNVVSSSDAIYGSRHDFTLKFSNAGTYEIKFVAQDVDGTEVAKVVCVTIEGDGLVKGSDGILYYMEDGLNVHFTGLAEYEDKWYYVEQGIVSGNKNGLTYINDTWYYLASSVWLSNCNNLIRYNDVWYYVENGVINWNYSGIYTYNGTDYYIQKGQLNWGINGLTNVEGVWYNLSNSAVNKGYTGLVQYGGRWYYVQKGILKWGIKTLVQYQGTWYYVNNSTLDWSYTGICSYNGTDYYIQNGQLNWGINGLTNVEGVWYNLSNSAVNKGYTGLVQYGGRWYYVQKGILKWGVKTLVQYQGTWYYVNNSTLDWNYTGIVAYGGTDYYVQKGQLNWGVNGLTNVAGTWYNLNNSAVNKVYTGLVQYGGNWYYVNKGVLDWNHTGIVTYGGTDYYVQKGQLRWGVNGLTNIGGTWYNLSNSAVNKGYTGLVQYGGNWYYVQKGQLIWGVNTLVQYNGTWYYVNNSTLDWSYMGLCEYNGTKYYIQKGTLVWGVNGNVVINGKTYKLRNSIVIN